MGIAWSTILVLLALLPGVAFFVGLSVRDRYNRELIRTSVAGDIAAAMFAATFIHLAALLLLRCCGFQPWQFFYPLLLVEPASTVVILWNLTSLFIAAATYILATSMASFLAGGLLAILISNGTLRSLAKHKWVHDLSTSDKSFVTVYIMTKTIENNRCLMYKGRLVEYYLRPDGFFSHVVLKNCSKFFMSFDGEEPKLTKQFSLFDETRRASIEWDYLSIDGANIANALFDKTGPLVPSAEGEKALNDAIAQARAAA